MTQQQITLPADAPAPLAWGPKPGMYASPALCAAFMYEVWKTSPAQFGNFMKKAMSTLWEVNGHA